MKQRIIKYTNGDKVHYEVETKFMFIWFTVKESNWSDIGCDSDTIKFKSEEEAADYIKKELNQIKSEIVWQK